MPKVVAPIQSPTMEELGDSVNETIKRAHRVLDAAAVAKTLEGLGIGSSASSEMQRMSEVFSGLTTGMKSLGELQASLVSQISQMIGNGGKTNLSDLIGLMLVMKMLDQPKQEKRDEVPPALEKLLNHLEEEIRELKETRGPSPVDQQIHSLTTQLLSQHIATLADPFSGLARLAEVKDKLKGVLGETNSVPPEYSEGALRLRALEKEEKALEMEHTRKLEELRHKEKIWSDRLPAIIAQAGAELTKALGSFGLTPTRPVQFDPDAVAAAESIINQ